MSSLPTDRSVPISHDRLFKDFYPELLALFCPDWLRRCDLTDLKFLDKELLSSDPAARPQDDDTEADLVALVHVLPMAPCLPGLEAIAAPLLQLLQHSEIQEGTSPSPCAIHRRGAGI